MVTKKKEESVHICLQDPLSKRRLVLQSAVDIIQLMKRHESIKRIRTEKEQTYNDFKKCIGSINFLFKKIKMQDMPLDSQDLKAYKIVKKQKTGIVAPVVKKMKKVLIQPQVKEDKRPALDRQLNDLQRKLNSL